MKSKKAKVTNESKPVAAPVIESLPEAVVESTPVVEEVVVESIKDINPTAPTLNYIGNVPVITETVQTVETPTIDESYYDEHTDDNLPMWLKAIVVIGILTIAYMIIYTFKMS